MPLVPFNPFDHKGMFPFDRDLEEIFEVPDKIIPMIPLRKKLFEPAANIYQTKDKVVVELNVPGFKPSDIDITLEDNVLTVKGKMEEKKEEKGKEYIRKEIRVGSFERQMPLPVEVKSEKTVATYEDGILKIEIPKKEAAKKTQVKRIPVKIKKA